MFKFMPAMRKPLKTLFLLEDLCYGGTQKQSLALALRLDRNYFEPAMLTLTGPTDMDAAASEVNLLHLGETRKVAPFFFWRLGKALAALKPDILVPCTALPNIWGRIWGRILKIPLIVGTCRGGGAPKRQHERFLWRLTDHIVCNSQASVEVMGKLGIPREYLSHIPNGIDSDFFAPAKSRDSSAILIVCVARLARDKDHATLIRAFGLAWRQNKNLRLRLVGEGPEEHNLKNLAAREMERDCADHIEFAGASENPLRHYQAADIFALSSTQEGQPNAILEAMSCALPVCATNVGGIPAMVRNEATGFLSAPGDAAALAANILLLAQNPALAAGMGAAGRELVQKNYSFDLMVNAHERLFKTLFEERFGQKLC